MKEIRVSDLQVSNLNHKVGYFLNSPRLKLASNKDTKKEKKFITRKNS